MDEKLKNESKKVMLVQRANGKIEAAVGIDKNATGKIEAVTDIDKDGNIETVEPTKRNIADLFSVNTNDSAVEAFFKKFMEQAENPSHTGIFMMTEEALKKLIKRDFDPVELEKYRVDPSVELQKLQKVNQEGDTTQAFQPMDITKIDRADMERKGIAWEAIEPHLKAMSYGHKSNALVEMSPELEPGGMRVPTQGRVSLEEQADGTLRVIPHYWQQQPNLDAPLHGIMLDDEVKANLLSIGNAGKIIHLELTPGKPDPCYVSLDKLTNHVEVLPTAAIQPIEKIKGVQLTTGQQMDLADGHKVLVEGMTSRTGRLFDGYIQINASDKKIEFTYEGLDRKRYSQENKQATRQQREGQKEQKEQGKDVATDIKQGQIFIPKKLLGVELDEKQTGRLEEGKPAYIKGMLKDAKGEPFNAWVKPNYEKGKLDFFKYNPDYARKKGAEVTPATESKTQVAVNSEGKTNEATKNVREPLRQGQQKPTQAQQKQQEQRQQPPVRRQTPAAPKKSGQRM